MIREHFTILDSTYTFTDACACCPPALPSTTSLPPYNRQHSSRISLSVALEIMAEAMISSAFWH